MELFSHYENELVMLRRLCREFAERYPKVAGNLRMVVIDIVPVVNAFHPFRQLLGYYPSHMKVGDHVIDGTKRRNNKDQSINAKSGPFLPYPLASADKQYMAFRSAVGI